MTNYDQKLTDLLHQDGDSWSPAANPNELARALNEGIAGDRVRLPDTTIPGDRPFPLGRAVRLGLTMCLLAALVAIPLVLHATSHRSQPPAIGPSSSTPSDVPATSVPSTSLPVQSESVGPPLRDSALKFPSNFVVGGPYNAMSCTAPDFCMVVGALKQSGQKTPAFLVVSAGHIGAPQPIAAAATQGAQLTAVSCSSPTSCVGTTGQLLNTPTKQVYFAHFDGTSWSPLAAPPGMAALMRSVRSPDSGFADVLTCLSSGSCLFLGWATGSAGPVVAATLSGTSWSALPSLPGNPQMTQYLIGGAACSSTQNCYVGATKITHHPGGPIRTCTREIPAKHGKVKVHVPCRGGGGLQEQPELLVWNGSTWSVSTALPPSAVGSLSGAGCDPNGNCYMVNGGGDTQAIELLKGNQSITEYSTPNQATLTQIVCPSAEYCIASSESGYGYPQHPQRQIYITLKNGKWSDRYANLLGNPTTSDIIGLSCVAPGDCYQLDMTTAEASFATTPTYLLHFGA